MMLNPYKLDWEVKIFVEDKLSQAQPNGVPGTVKPARKTKQVEAGHLRSLPVVRSVIARLGYVGG